MAKCCSCSPWYRLRFSLDGDDLGELDWADFGPDGAFLSARDGRLFRDGTEVADLRSLKYERRASPPSARLVKPSRWQRRASRSNPVMVTEEPDA
jgi:hypothetical protein